MATSIRSRKTTETRPSRPRARQRDMRSVADRLRERALGTAPEPNDQDISLNGWQIFSAARRRPTTLN